MWKLIGRFAPTLKFLFAGLASECFATIKLSQQINFLCATEKILVAGKNDMAA
jgi:hypothetical protein